MSEPYGFKRCPDFPNCALCGPGADLPRWLARERELLAVHGLRANDDDHTRDAWDLLDDVSRRIHTSSDASRLDSVPLIVHVQTVVNAAVRAEAAKGPASLERIAIALERIAALHGATKP